ncbi:predicted protein [Naegleria gruberi]|uniref:Predicted protein n=1 Tax=Naegleria gruberi TaxID=5762 RepID=D2UX65_NAEGR|nr:uncharacterized protein NAEGRDRAFT_61654 [Naegleria gruberi]EFC50876.1 predicted protein [Naegleria gruberi]|eukprot:XP_002683620.1 predicted protein [Naegleria gruberi strain NEG-M]
MKHDSSGQQLFNHLVHNELVEWLISLYSENNNITTRNQVSDWNKSFAKFNLLFPSSQQALSEQECILDIILNYNLINNDRVSIESSSLQANNCLSFHLNLLFNPLMAMKINDGMCLHDFRATFSYPNIRQYNFPKIISLLVDDVDLLSGSTSDSVLNLFTTQQSLPECIETVFNIWNEQRENRKTTYSSYSWAPLERKINILMSNGDEDERTLSIPEPPMIMEDNTDSLREKSWRIRKLENGDIDCFLSSDESIMQVDYFCKLLEKHIPNLDSNAIQQSLLTDSVYKNSKFEEWMVQIRDNIPYTNNDSDWFSLMTCLVSYCFGECTDLFKDLLRQLDYFRDRIFRSSEDEISIREITPEIVDSVFTPEEKENLESLLVKMDNILKSNSIGKCPINLTNWMTIALLYDLYRAEQTSFMKVGLLDRVFESLQTKVPSITDQVPFTFSPTFIIILLATRSHSNHCNITAPTIVSEISRNISLSPEYYSILKECKSGSGDLFIRGAKLDYLLCHIIDNCSGDSHLELNRKGIQAIIQNMYHKSVEEILRENVGRDENFDFLCSLSILIVRIGYT